MNLVDGQIGIVSEIDAKNMKARVTLPTDDFVTHWLHIISWGVYWMPEVKDQVACIFDEEYNQGIIIGIVKKDGDAPYSDADTIGFKIGTAEIKISKASGSITVISNEAVNVKSPKITLEADEVKITKKLSVGTSIEAGSTIDAKGAIKSLMEVTAKTTNL